MEFARSIAGHAFAWTALVAAALLAAPASAEQPTQAAVRFQKPSRGAKSTASNANLQFRSSSQAPSVQAPVEMEAAPEPAPAAQRAAYEAAKPLSTAPAVGASREVRQAPATSGAKKPAFTQPGSEPSVPAFYHGEPVSYRTAARPTRSAAGAPWYGEETGHGRMSQAAYCESCVDCCEPDCGIVEPVCGCAEPTCGICEATCGIMEPGCGLVDPGCGIVEPGCGVYEPSCGCDDVGCGSCVGNPGPDYWCFPVCLPRLKELSVWAGVHGFKGPRDVFDGGTDANFGFQEGINIGGRAPLVGLLFPQLSYQLGYQAVQSRLSGSSAAAFAPTDERNQDFLTVGLFRRVPAGVQFGAVFDMMNDDFRTEEDFHQMRYEISIKSQQGREIGFWGATHTNNRVVGGRDYQAVDQYVAFVRWHFREAAEARFWGGATNDHEGLFGGDFYAPLNNRWSLNAGFNYLITDEANGPLAAQEESWNVGMNLVWHYGRTAKQSRFNPHRPLFSVADNGWMFIDERP